MVILEDEFSFPLMGYFVFFTFFYMNHDCLEKEVEYRPRALGHTSG